MAHRLDAGAAVDDLLAPYRSVPRRADGRAWVLANMVAGLTGSTTVEGRVGSLSTGDDARLFTELRALADVVLVGAETVRRERYGPVRLPEHLVEWRCATGRAPAPRLALVSRSLAFDWTMPLFASGDVPTVASGDVPTVASGDADRRPLLLTCAATGDEQRATAARHAEVLVVGDEQVDLALAVEQLATQGAGVVLCEGGPQVLGELVALDLLDELCLSIAPLAGGDGLPIVTGPPLPLRRFALRTSLLADDGSLLLRYERDRSDVI